MMIKKFGALLLSAVLSAVAAWGLRTVKARLCGEVRT